MKELEMSKEFTASAAYAFGVAYASVAVAQNDLADGRLEDAFVRLLDAERALAHARFLFPAKLQQAFRHSYESQLQH